jgi:hypothetical protein
VLQWALAPRMCRRLIRAETGALARSPSIRSCCRRSFHRPTVNKPKARMSPTLRDTSVAPKHRLRKREGHVPLGESGNPIKVQQQCPPSGDISTTAQAVDQTCRVELRSNKRGRYFCEKTSLPRRSLNRKCMGLRIEKAVVRPRGTHARAFHSVCHWRG